MMRLLVLYISLFLAFSIHTAEAASSPWQADDSVRVRLISGVDAVGSLAQIPLALDIHLSTGWHSYWRSPGDAGLPPQLDWKASENLKLATLLYPAPHRYSAAGLETIGYTDHVVMPIDAELIAPNKPLILKNILDILVCGDICLPKHFVLHLDLPSGDAAPSAEASIIDEARHHIPTDDAHAGIRITNFTKTNDALHLTITSQDAMNAPELFIENEKNIAFAKPEITLSDDKHAATVTAKLADKLPDDMTLTQLPITVTVADGDHALEQTLDEPKVIAPIPAAPAHHKNVWAIILLALMGGFILNLMPCVLPVLSLKVLGAIGHGGGENRVVRRSFLMTAAGIVFSFLALAAVTIGLKETGQAIGWGVQFQQPVFLVFLIVLITFFAANLWGLFEIPLPRFLANRFNAQYHPKMGGDFATGAFATLLATPCSAPFLGTAIGFALASGAFEILAVFLALGIGMSVPYLAIALYPRLATALPRPGAWMLTLRQILGFALALTALWLLWVLAAETSTMSASVVAACLLIIIKLLDWQEHERFGRHVKWGVSLAIAACFVMAFLSMQLFPHTEKATQETGWEKFDEAAIAGYVAQGKVVFVDVTADWCLTCKANKKFILSQDEITQRLFHDPHVVAMQADWTNPNPAIAAYLQKNGRYGIPFNAVYGSGSTQPIVLPELLTSKAVLDGLTQAGAK